MSSNILNGASTIAGLIKPLLRTIYTLIKGTLQLLRAPLSAIGTLVVLGFLLLAIFGEQIAPYAYDADAITTRFALRPNSPPDCFAKEPLHIPIVNFDIKYFDPINAPCQTPFGTTKEGRDVYSRIILGTREIFRLAGIGTLIAVLIGTTIGLFAGYQGGWIDEIIGRILDSLLSMPALLLALILIGTLPDDIIVPIINYEYNLRENSLLVVLAVVYAPIVARVVRSVVLSVKVKGFVEAARLRGESTFYILSREILPSVIPALVVEASLRFSYGIFLVASLGYLGLGTDPPTPNWGLMVSEAYNDLDFERNPWTLTYPTLAIVILVVSVNLMSDGIKRLVQRSE
ncbi:MAG: ABC transporter permease [Phototrophicales bacterium]|nr:MAG: ABC transporter permease [Phototrophicales bacterium]